MVAYSVGAWLVLWPLPLANNSVLPGAQNGDPVQQAWFMALARWALTTGHFSFLVHKIFFPTGFNVLDNGSASLLGALAAPVTAVLGPVASFDLMLRLAFVVSATAGYFALRRLRVSWVAAAVGGAIYGFSPYMTHNSTYLFLVFVPLPPLIFLVVHGHLRRSVPPGGERGWRPALRRGGLVGVMAAAQFMISSEILDTTALILASTLLILAALRGRHPGTLAVPAAAFARLATVTVIVATSLLAYPVWFALAGPEHITAATAVAHGPGIDWAHTLWPVDRHLVAGHLPTMATSGPTHHGGDSALIGIPLLLVVVAAVVLYRRRPPVPALAVLTASAWVWALGTRLVHRGLPTGIPLPFALLANHVLFQDVVRPRLTLYVGLGIAGLSAIALDRWLRTAVSGAFRPTRALSVAGIAFVIFGAVYLSPASRTPTTAAAAGPPRALAALPAGAVVLAYPFPTYPDDQAMLWQARAGFRFSLVGGYAYQQDPAQDPLLTSAVVTLLQAAWAAAPVSPQLADAAMRELPELAARYDITAAVIDTSPRCCRAGPVTSRGAPLVERMLTAVYGQPQHDGRYDLWHLPQRASTRGPGGAS